MEYIINKPENKHIVILVHGLNGSAGTWKGTDQRLVENLGQEKLIQDNFNLALFTYGTHIFEISWFTKIRNLIRGFFSNSPKEDIHKFNVGIEAISRPLESQVRGLKNRYNTISFIAHSMGGLVTKSALTWLDEETRQKTPLYISLAVPHIGSQLAIKKALTILLGNNPQIIDLKAMGDFTTSLNERYSGMITKPKIIYQSGNQDTVVPRPSAIPPNVTPDLYESTEDDHFSVLLCKDRTNNVIFERIMRELNLVTQPILGVDAGVPQGVFLVAFIRLMAAKIGFAIQLNGFTDEELNIPLREGNISSPTIIDFLNNIRTLAIDPPPSYTVTQKTGSLVYVLTKTDSQ